MQHSSPINQLRSYFCPERATYHSPGCSPGFESNVYSAFWPPSGQFKRIITAKTRARLVWHLLSDKPIIHYPETIQMNSESKMSSYKQRQRLTDPCFGGRGMAP